MVIEVFIDPQRNTVEEPLHIAAMGNGHTYLAHLTSSHGVIWVVSGLRGQIESDRQAGLTFVEVASV